MSRPPGKAAPLPKGWCARNVAVSSRCGTVLNALFTIAAAPRYSCAMMMLALLAAQAAQPDHSPLRPVHATATVRILSGKQVVLGATTPEAELRRTSVRESDGQVRPARLIEFQ